jgi:hypothetical protein
MEFQNSQNNNRKVLATSSAQLSFGVMYFVKAAAAGGSFFVF